MRYIDADKLCPDCMTKDGKLAISQSQLANAPTVEPEVYMNGKDFDLYLEGYKQGKKDFERPQGEWITRHKENSFGQDVVCFECNKCGEYKLPIIHTMITEPLGVCPNCGVNMQK